MKKYFSPIVIVAAFFSGVAAGVAASFFLPPLRSLLIGIVVAVLALFAIPSRFSAKNNVFNAQVKKLGSLDVNAPVMIVTSKKTYPARLCATREKITFLFCFKGHIVPLVFRRAEGVALTVAKDGFVSLSSKDAEKGVFFTSAPLLSNISNVVDELKKLGY